MTWSNRFWTTLWSPRKASSGGSPGVDPAALWKSQEAADPALILGRVRRLEIRTRRVVDQILTGEYHSIFRGQGMEFHEVRPYVAGDEVRTIDWNVTARAGVPYVKTFVETRELTVLLMVDVSASSLFGTGTASKRDLVEETAALLIFSAIRNRDRVGLVLFSDRVEKVILPRRGRRHGLRLLSELLEFRPRGRGSDLTEPLEAAAKLLRRRALVFILCDFLLPDASGVLKRVVRRHDVIPVVIEDPREESLPAVGLVELEDLETGRRSWVDTGHPGVRRRFAEKAAQRAQGQKTMFGRLGLDAVWLRTGVDPARPLQKLFQLRMRRRSGGTAVRGTSRVVAP